MTESDRSPAGDGRGSVLLLGCYRPALTLARSLSLAGYRVIAGPDTEPLGAGASRFVDEFWQHPDLSENPRKFVKALKLLLEARPDIVSVLPVAEEFSLFFASHPSAIPDGVQLASPAPKTVKLFSDKTRTLALARKVGVPTLPYARVRDHDGLLEAAQSIGFPITVRGLGATARLAGKKALICDTFEELLSTLPCWPKDHAALLLQRFARGRRHNLYFAAQDGKLIAIAESEIFRTNAPDGTGLAVDGRTRSPDLRLVEDTEALAAAANYTGIGLAQFLVDPCSGERCFLELNPRVSGSHAVPERAGVPLSRLAIDLAGGKSAAFRKRFAERSFVGEGGLRYAWTGGDLLAMKYALAGGEISATSALGWLFGTVKTALRANFHLVASWYDLAPAVLSALLLLPRAGSLCEKFKELCADRPAAEAAVPGGEPRHDTSYPASSSASATA